MNCTDKNLELIRRRFPTLLVRLQHASKSEIRDDALLNASAQSRDWGALLERWLSGVEVKEDQAIVLSGFGDGSHVRALLNHLPLSSHVFCLEKNASLFLDVMAQEGIGELLEDPRFYLGIGELDQDCFNSLCRFPTLEVLGANPVIFAPSFNVDPEYYSKGFREFARSLDYWRKMYGTNVTASGKWQNNSLENINALIGAPDISVFEGAFSGESMIVASAGPSLDESLEFIKEHQDEVVVVAVNSSYRALRNAGIVPHFVIAADPYEYTDKGFEGVDCSETILLCPFIVFPKVPKRFGRRLVTWSASNVLISQLRKAVGLNQGTHVLEMGTVSACSFDIAEIFGCERVLFLGQDLAFRDDGQMHASDSFYSDMGVNQFASQHFREMPGNTVPIVKVEEKLYVYLKVFESLVKERKGGRIKFRNASRLGAQIEGMGYLPLSDAGKWISKGGATINKRLEYCHTLLIEDLAVKSSVFEELRLMSEFVETLCRSALSAAVTMEMKFPLVEGETVSKEAYGLALEKKNEIQALLDSNDRYLDVLNDGALKYELVLYRRALKSFDDHLDLHEPLEFFWAVAEASFSFSSVLVKVIEESTYSSLG